MFAAWLASKIAEVRQVGGRPPVRRSCSNCHFWDNYRCHRHAATSIGFPPTSSLDWCGEHMWSLTHLRNNNRSA